MRAQFELFRLESTHKGNSLSQKDYNNLSGTNKSREKVLIAQKKSSDGEKAISLNDKLSFLIYSDPALAFLFSQQAIQEKSFLQGKNVSEKTEYLIFLLLFWHCQAYLQLTKSIPSDASL